MIVSYEWLKKYFDDLPRPEEIANLFSLYLTEVENVEKKGADTVFDIKVLSDRNCYAQSHRGIAYELAAIMRKPAEKIEIPSFDMKETKLLDIVVEEKKTCPRYIGRRVEGVRAGSSPSWLKERLEAIGQRSINSVVDSLNYVMFDMGQPLHAFDADKIRGTIVIRYAKDDETVVLLDGREVSLDSNTLVIADDHGPLALAGIKGGKRAEVNEATKNIIIESANFDKSLIRSTSTRLNIRSDASKRYEGGLTPAFAEIGMEEATSLIFSLNKEAAVGEEIDVKTWKEKEARIKTSVKEINALLGVSIPQETIFDILDRLNIMHQEHDGTLSLTPPIERIDLVIPEDIAEEIARLYGYENISPIDLPLTDMETTHDISFLKKEKVKDILIGLGFSEIMTHTLVSKGDLEIEKSAAEDKNYIRTNLIDNMIKSLSLNAYNAPLLGLETIKLFEIGKIFPASGEITSLCVGVSAPKSKKKGFINEEIRQTRDKLLEILDSKITTVCTIDDMGGMLVLKGKTVGKINEIDGIMELDLDALIGERTFQLENADLKLPNDVAYQKYRAPSPYPFVIRDIAAFSDEEGREKSLLNIIRKEAGDLLIRSDLFDKFTKVDKDTGTAKTSYAFHLIFQANDRTLNDQDINKIMTDISHKMAEQGYKVR